MVSQLKNEEKKVIRPRGILIVAILMVLFGLTEVVTGFTHKFFGITTSVAFLFTIAGSAIGIFYILSGVLILIGKKWAAALAIVLLVADIIGRIALVVTGYYPINTLENVVGIIGGTAIAIIFTFYIAWKWKIFN